MTMFDRSFWEGRWSQVLRERRIESRSAPQMHI
jgi:hypothetical protein